MTPRERVTRLDAAGRGRGSAGCHGSLTTRLDRALRRARALVATGQDEAARQSYVDVLRLDPTHFSALNEMGVQALAGGYRSAARTAFAQAARLHPGRPIARVNLGNLLLDDGDAVTARMHFEAALAADAYFPEAHQGLARALTELGDDEAAEAHWIQGFVGHATVIRPYRGDGVGIPLLLRVAAQGGNIPTRHWIDERRFAVTAIYADFHDRAHKVPAAACDRGERDRRRRPLRSRAGERRSNVGRRGRPDHQSAGAGALYRAGCDGTSPRGHTGCGHADNRKWSCNAAVRRRTRDFTFPLLLRAPGFHTGRHFAYVENAAAFAPAAAAIPGEEVFVIEFLAARGRDGMARKYRVMFIGGALYPTLHLAISADWKVHYVSAAMARNDRVPRGGTQRFLDDKPAVLGPRAMTALAAICQALGLDYAGVDFALSPTGSLLVFEANATMAIIPPGPEPMWDYRRPRDRSTRSRPRGICCHDARARLSRCPPGDTRLKQVRPARRVERHIDHRQAAFRSGTQSRSARRGSVSSGRRLQVSG